ncbi:ABC transporter ATP-binding protein [Amycolatopsis suaedae]|uniref:ABC transporter ATP-binding protein n=1 Tax=Amycolatopsis suaedae TaxID=2510978 RepID=UPI0026BB12FA
MNHPIQARSLTKRFGDVLAVDDLTFDVPEATVTGFLGPNGAGKTTTMRMLLGLVTPTAGSATITGRRYADLDRPADVVGAVLDRAGFHPARSARDHLRVYAAMGGYPASRVDEVLGLVAATGFADRPAGTLSTGMRQRLHLATALLGRPRILLLDEPANGLDPAGIAWLRGFLSDLARDGRTVLVSSHALAEAERLVDHVVVVSAGRLVAAGPLATVVPAGSSLEQTFLTLTGGVR